MRWATDGAETAAARGQDGFTLLEGLVAIALLAGTLATIFSLVGGILTSAQRIGSANDVAQMRLNALEVMRTVNPMLEGTGQIRVGPYAIQWRSAAITPVTDGAGYPAGLNLYKVAL